SPANGASFSAGMNIAVNASASDSDGSVAKVEFFNGSTKLGEDLSAPYSYTMSSAVAGSYSLKARATDNAGAIKDSAAVSITVNAVTQPPPSTSGTTLLTSQVPAQVNLNDGVAYELGMKFTSTVSGKITGIRFYKGSSESGTRTGKIYSSTGALLASVTFPAGTASGWQQATLASPLSIAANTQYTVSVNTGAGYYVATNDGMASQISSGSLRSVVGNNGVYGPVGARPTNSYQNSNYFRDIVFVADSSSSPSPAPVASTITVDNLAPGASSSAVSFTGKWCDSSVTPYYGTRAVYSCGPSTTADTYTLRPNVTVAKQYDVYIQYTSWSNRNKATSVTISSASGTVSKSVDQTINSSTFVLLGRYSFNVGTSGYVKISNVNAANGDNNVSIDAIRLVPVP
ncbi:MAG: DUF4082 domain-containing protein, partial [Pseudobdellovibrionaceae bacterium]